MRPEPVAGQAAMLAKGVTSEPVPDVVGMQTKADLR